MQVLTEGMLLHCDGLLFSTQANMPSQALVCSSCVDALKDHTVPVLSLANGMWIGDIPLVLWILTIPKCILVVRYFPAAYIVKLYPMKKGARSWLIKSLHSGL